MLGRHADQFFAKHRSERVLAGVPNGMSESLNWPDRGDKGSQSRYSVPGNYETPGPQNVHVQNEMMPGMGMQDMMPGMGMQDMMPGMGGVMQTLKDNKGLVMGILAVAGIGYYMSRK